MLGALTAKFALKISPEDEEHYVKEEENQVIATLEKKAEPCVGCTPVLESIEASGKYLMAVVSSSALRRVNASLKKVGQDKFFGDRVYSAATSLPKPTSKPDPAVYIHAMEKLGKDKSECVAVEDSKSGTLSAARAGIKVIGYVGSYEKERQDEMKEKLIAEGCQVVMYDWNEFEDMLKKIESE